MGLYIPAIKEDNNGHYALIVRVDEDKSEHVIHGYKGRYFKTHKAANKSTTAYIKKHELNGVATV